MTMPPTLSQGILEDCYKSNILSQILLVCYSLLSIDLFVTCGGSVIYYVSVYHPIPTMFVGIGNILAIFKTNQ